MAKPKKLKNTFHWHLGDIICNMRWVMITKIIVEMGIIQSSTFILSIILFFKPCKLLNSQYKDIEIYAWKFRLYQIFANVNISMNISKKIDMFLLLLMRGINAHNKRDVPRSKRNGLHPLSSSAWVPERCHSVFIGVKKEDIHSASLQTLWCKKTVIGTTGLLLLHCCTGSFAKRSLCCRSLWAGKSSLLKERCFHQRVQQKDHS